MYKFETMMQLVDNVIESLKKSTTFNQVINGEYERDLNSAEAINELELFLKYNKNFFSDKDNHSISEFIRHSKNCLIKKN